MNFSDLAITSLDQITAFTIGEGDYLFTLDELQNATIAQSEDKQEITGKRGRRLATLKRNKAIKISGTNGLVSGGLAELQTGSKFNADTVTTVRWREVVKVNASHKANTTYKATGTMGAEIISANIMDDKTGVLGAALAQNASASEGEFQYAPTSKELTFHTDVLEGTQVVVTYDRKIKADVMNNASDAYSSKCMLYIDATAEGRCGDIYHVQFQIPKADFSGEFSLELGDNQTVHAFEAESLAGACGGQENLFTWIVFGADTPDEGAKE